MEGHELASSHSTNTMGDFSTEQKVNEVNSFEEIKNVSVDKGILSEDNIDFPEGGFQGWLTTFGSFCGLIAVFGIENVTGIFEEYLQTHQLAEVNSSKIGWIFSIFPFICSVSGIFSGIYFDRNGFKKIVIIGTILHVGGLFAMANSAKYWHFILSFSIICGFGNGLALSPLIICPSHYFKRRRGLAIACGNLGSCIGGGVFPFLLRRLFRMTSDENAYYGFQWGIRVLAFINLTLLIISIVCAKERLSYAAELKGSKFIERFKKVSKIYALQSFDAKGLVEPLFLSCVVGFALCDTCLNVATTYFTTYATTRGISASDSKNLVSVMNFCSIPGSLIPGMLCDVFGRFNIMIGTMIALTLLIFVGWLPFAKSLASFYVISALFGYLQGTIYSLLVVCCGQVSKTTDFGKRYATSNLIASGTILYAVPIAGAIIGSGSHRGYENYIVYCGVLAIAGGIAMFVTRIIAVGFTWKKY
ncbi:hypothetical protein KAFR_0C00100 [Kazachstania africana CBS 2517]|uniref:Major facilitator superfamily (MFS) profile domain-containing protein n=1 Tax=Kazachstania africana (strain ATCC 22294 / BCRC 22015 / CBS 2517 / CECT 1963 / NBRC 1671 / NRRL Y-8276) TaxID=1071382 RepID=H2ARK8_KAZAF|nr:hypothetical protein KAFR_0C00100 [Kazachstania africana CBS 2517]CCF57008.1 hypothetical protein KAFR_0C00100 [Kazachstania africana CBS 2517]